MKLLFDANISHRLADSLSDLYPGSRRTNGFSIVSKDSDFHPLSFPHGAPPKVVWIRLGNCRTIEIEKGLRARHESLVHFLADEKSAFLVLGR